MMGIVDVFDSTATCTDVVESARAGAGRVDRRKRVDRQYSRNARGGYITGVRVCEPLSPLD